MKYLSILVVVVLVCLYYTRKNPDGFLDEGNRAGETISPDGATPTPKPAGAPTPSAGSALRRPLDRAHEVADKLKKRNSGGEF